MTVEDEAVFLFLLEQLGELIEKADQDVQLGEPQPDTSVGVTA